MTRILQALALSLLVMSAALAQVNPKTFGAICDGTSHTLSERFATLAAAQVRYPHATGLTQTIDWAAIQATVNSIGTSKQGGYTVAFTPGICVVNDTITVGLRRLIIRGPGIIGSNSATIKQTDANKDILDYTTGSTDTLSIYGMQFQGASSAGTGRGILLGQASQSEFDCRIADNWFVGMPSWAVYATKINDCHFTDNGFDASGSSTVGGIYVVDGSNLKIEHNTFYSQTASGIVLKNGEDNSIRGNWFNFSGGANDTSAAILIDADAASSKFVRATLIAVNNFRANGNDIVINGHGGVNGSNTGANDTLISSNLSDRSNRRFLLATDAHQIRLIGNAVNSPSQAGDGSFPAVEITGTSDAAFVNSNKVSDQTAGGLRPSYGLTLGTSTTSTTLGKNEFTGKTGKYSVGAGATFNSSTSNMEGSWTPRLFGSGTAGTNTYSAQLGKWRLEGGLVWVTGQIVMTAKDGAMAGNIGIKQLPFDLPAADHPVSAAIGGFSSITLAANRYLTLRSDGTGNGQLALLASNSAGALGTVVAADIAAATEIDFTLVYRPVTGAFNANGGANTIN